VQQAVHGRARQQRIAEELMELVGVAVRGDDGRATFVSEPDDLVEVDRLVAFEWSESEVVDDEQVHLGESHEPLVVRVVGAARLHLLQHILG
jgi:hypothetical protein